MADANKTVEQVCEEFGELCEGVHVNSFGYIEDMTQTDACNFINDILAAHEREIEIASKYSAEHEARIFDALRKRDALIKELADALNEIVEGDDGICDCNCSQEYECPNRSKVCFPHFRSLVKKAREVVNG